MKQITLTQGLFALVSDEDFDSLSVHPWCANYYKGVNSFYASTNRAGHTILMHRLILGAVRGVLVDHINHNTLDNRRENLRLCSHAENRQNMVMHRDNVAGFKGVSKLKDRWRARIHVLGKEVALGCFDTPEAAAAAYDVAARQYYGEFAYTNEGGCRCRM